MNKLKLLVFSRWSLVIIILIIAAFLRLHNITKLPPGLYPDEAMNGNNALETLSSNGKFKIFYPENNGREGLFINIQAFSVYLFGNESLALRFPSAIFGILTVLGLYFLAKELFKSEKIALLSSFFLATSFWHINFSRIGFRAIMAPFFLTWAVYFLLLALRKIKELKPPKFYILNSIFSGIFFGLGFHSYIAYRVTPLLIVIIISHWLLVNKDWQTRRKILLSTFYFLIFTFIVIAPLGFYFLQHPQDFFGRTTQVSVFNSLTPLKDLTINILKTAGMFNFSGDWNWRHNIAGQSLLFWPVGILFITGLFLGIKSIFQISNVQNININNKTSDVLEIKLPFIILFSWFIIASLPVIISNEGLPHALRAILMTPPIFILTGFGSARLIEKIKNQAQIATDQAKLLKSSTNRSWTSKTLKIKIISQNSKFFYFLLTTFYLLIIFNAYYSYFITWGKNPNIQSAFAQNYVDIGRQLNALPKEMPKYIIVKAGGIDVRGLPMSTQTTMFITDTFTSEKQKEKNIFYILPNETNKIPQGAYIIILE